MTSIEEVMDDEFIEEVREAVDEDGSYLSKEFVKDIVVEVAESRDVTETWDDIRVTDRDGPLAWADLEERTIYINVGTPAFPRHILPQVMGGLMAHEKGHLEKRLAVPGTEERFKRQHEEVEERLKPHMPSQTDYESMAQQLLNVVQDLEIHHQILEQDHYRLSVQKEVQKFVNRTRIHTAQDDPESLILCRDIQETEEQQEAKEVVEDRTLSIVDKAVELGRLMDTPSEDDDDDSDISDSDEPEDDGDEEESGEPDEDGLSTESNSSSPDSGDDGESDTAGVDSQDDGDDEVAQSSVDDHGSDDGDTEVSTSPGDSGSTETGGAPDITPITQVGSPTDDRNEKDVDTSDVWLDDVGESIGDTINELNDRSDVYDSLRGLGVDDDEARKMVKQRDIQQLKQHISTLDNVLEDVIPSLESAREGPDGSRNGRPGGEEFDGYRAPVDATEMAGSPVDLLTIGRVSRDEVKVERRSHTRSRSGVVFILRDTSGSMVMGEKAKLARDATVSLIKTAQKYDHKVGVIDFAGNAIPHYSDGGQQIISRDYHEFMVESMELKSGGGTDLDAALSAVNSIINARDLHSVPINIYVITDSEIPPVQEEIVSDDPKLNTVWTHSQSHLHRSMRELTERYGGDIYRLRNTRKDDLLAEIYEQY